MADCLGVAISNQRGVICVRGGRAFGDIFIADPALFDADPIALLLVVGDGFAGLNGTDLFVISAGAITDIQGQFADSNLAQSLGIAVGNHSGVLAVGRGGAAGGRGAGGRAVHLYILQADPAVGDLTPVAVGFQNLDLVALLDLADGVVLGAGALTDVQALGSDGATLAASGGGGSAGSCGGGLGGGLGCGRSIFGGSIRSLAVEGDILHVDPAFCSAAPGHIIHDQDFQDFQAGAHSQLLDRGAVGVGLGADIELVSVDSAHDDFGLSGSDGGGLSFLGRFRILSSGDIRLIGRRCGFVIGTEAAGEAHGQENHGQYQRQKSRKLCVSFHGDTSISIFLVYYTPQGWRLSMP